MISFPNHANLRAVIFDASRQVSSIESFNYHPQIGCLVFVRRRTKAKARQHTLTVEPVTVPLKKRGVFGKNYIKDNEKAISLPQKAETEPTKDSASFI